MRSCATPMRLEMRSLPHLERSRCPTRPPRQRRPANACPCPGGPPELGPDVKTAPPPLRPVRLLRWPWRARRKTRRDAEREHCRPRAGRLAARTRRCPRTCRAQHRCCRYNIANGVASVGGGNARSSAARSSFVRRSSRAALFSRTCETLAAFGIATTPSCRSSQASAT